MMSRRIGGTLLAVGALSLLSACSTEALPGPGGGWRRERQGRLLLAVPEDWDRAEPDAGLWDLRLDAPDGSGDRVLVASSTDFAGAEVAADAALRAARSATRGLLPAGQRTAVTDGTTTVVRQDYTMTWPVKGTGTIWGAERDGAVSLVDVAGTGVTEAQRDTIGEWIELEKVSATGSPGVPDGYTSVSSHGVVLALPSTWQAVGGVDQSERWLDGWAEVSDTGRALQRVLIAPSMPQEDVAGALAQIEVDAAAGALDGYVKTDRQVLDLDDLDEAVRTDFTYGAGGTSQGCLWVVRQGDIVVAVQYVAEGDIDTTVRDTIESLLAVNTV